MRFATRAVLLCAGPVAMLLAANAQAANTAASEVARGEYLVNFGGCHDCHSPKR